MMQASPLTILRVGLGITFVWIAVLIYREPDAWSGLIPTWIDEMMPGTARDMMIQTAVLDLLIGILLILGLWTWVAALLGAIHLLSVIIAIPFGDTTARDFGLLSGCVSLLLSTPAPAFVRRIFKRT